MAIPISHSAQPLFLFDYRGYTNTLHSYIAFTVRQRLFTAFTKYGLCVVNDIPLRKESIPFLSPQLRAWVDCSVSTRRPFSCMFPIDQKEGKNPAFTVRTGGDSSAKPPGERNTAEGKKTVFSPQGTRDRSETFAAWPAEQCCSLSLPCSAGAAQASGLCSGERGLACSPRSEKGHTRCHPHPGEGAHTAFPCREKAHTVFPCRENGHTR